MFVCNGHLLPSLTWLGSCISLHSGCIAIKLADTIEFEAKLFVCKDIGRMFHLWMPFFIEQVSVTLSVCMCAPDSVCYSPSECNAVQCCYGHASELVRLTLLIRRKRSRYDTISLLTNIEDEMESGHETPKKESNLFKLTLDGKRNILHNLFRKHFVWEQWNRYATHYDLIV